MIGLMSLVRRSTVMLSSSPLLSSLRTCSCSPSLALSRTRCELSLFFRIDWMADGAPTVTLIGIFRTTETSSIIGRLVGSETTITSALPSLRHGTNS